MKLVHFEKKMGLVSAVSITVGAVIGVGIFVIVGPICAKSGSWAPMAFAFASLPALFGTLVAVALGSTIPTDAGGYYYTKNLLGGYAGACASVLVVMGALGALSSVSVGVADYLRMYFPNLSRPLIVIILILLSWVVNYLGLMASVKFQIAMVAQLVSGLLIIIIAGLVGGAHPDFSQSLPSGSAGFLEASAIAMMVYTGFNIIAELGDEVTNPHRNIPLTIILGLGIIMFVYIAVGWVVSGTMSVSELEQSKVALLDTALRYLPHWSAHYLNLAALTGAITSINAVFIAAPRELFALSQEKILPYWLERFDQKRQTFPRGIIVVAVIGCGLALLNLDPDIWGLVCVCGLSLANVFFSIGVLRLFSLFPEEVKRAPFPIKKYWVYPSGIISIILSLGFGIMCIVFYPPILYGLIPLLAGILILNYRQKRPL